MEYNNLKQKITLLITILVVLPTPIFGITMWIYSLLFKSIWFYLFLPIGLIFSFVTYYISLILIISIVIKKNKPLKEGVFNINSKEAYEWLKSITLLNLIAFPKLLGVPTSGLRKIYSWLFPAKLGKTLIMEGDVEHTLVDIGDNTIIGHNSEIWGHLVEGNKVFIKKVKIGKNCTIGAKSIIMPGAIIGDNTIVGALSLVPKNKVLKPNSVYVGIPVKRIKKNNI